MGKKQNGSKKANNIILFGTSRTFRTFFDNSDYFWRLPKTSEDSWGLQKIRRLPKLSVYSQRNPKTWILLQIGRNKRLQPPLSTRFYSLESCFFVLEFYERDFPGLCCLKNKLEQGQFLDQNYGLTPLEKCQFFDFLNFLFL